jgi:hypothetical protein
MADSELTKILQERMATKYGVKEETTSTPEPQATETETTEVVSQGTDTTSTETVAETEVTTEQTLAPVAPSPLKEALAKANIAVDQYSEDEIGSQLANIIAERDEQRRQMQELQAQLEQLRQVPQQYVPQQVAPQQPEPTREDAQKLQRWQRVEVNQDLVKYCEYDDRTSRFLPDPKYGHDGVAAAKALNDAVAEQQRRSQLMVNDLPSALKEAGVIDEIDQRIESRLQEYNKRLAQTLTEKQQEVLAQRQQRTQEEEFQRFYEEHKSEFFKTDTNGNLMLGLDKKEVPTERGVLYSAKVREVCEELGVSEPNLKVWKLAYKLLPPKEAPKTPEQIAAEKKQQVEAKKNQFVEQARKQPEAKKPAQIAAAFVQPAEPTAGRKLSFREMLERDPDNAELIGAHYKGN